jgi:hypothetical protein
MIEAKGINLWAAEPPTTSFEQTLISKYGWSKTDAELQVDALSSVVAETYTHFGGTTDGQLPIGVDREAVLKYVEENESPYIGEWAEDIADLVCWWLSGEGDNS